MVEMLSRNRVRDYATWKKVFDSQADGPCNAGLRLKSLWRDIEDPNNVYFLFDVEDVGRAKAFISDPAAAEVGAEAGVIEGDVAFLEREPDLTAKT